MQVAHGCAALRALQPVQAVSPGIVCSGLPSCCTARGPPSHSRRGRQLARPGAAARGAAIDARDACAWVSTCCARHAHTRARGAGTHGARAQLQLRGTHRASAQKDSTGAQQTAAEEGHAWVMSTRTQHKRQAAIPLAPPCGATADIILHAAAASRRGAAGFGGAQKVLQRVQARVDVGDGGRRIVPAHAIGGPRLACGRPCDNSIQQHPSGRRRQMRAAVADGASMPRTHQRLSGTHRRRCGPRFAGITAARERRQPRLHVAQRGAR